MFRRQSLLIRKRASTEDVTQERVASSRCCLLIERDLGSKTSQVTPHRHCGKPLPVSPIGDCAVMRARIAVEIEAIPLFRMAHVIDDRVILLGPKKGTAAKR